MKWFVYELGEAGRLVDVEGYSDRDKAVERFSERREARLGACIVFAEEAKIPAERAERLAASVKVAPLPTKTVHKTRSANVKSKKKSPTKTVKAKATKAKTVKTKAAKPPVKANKKTRAVKK